MKRCLVNGVITTGIDAGDRGLHYADGLFETIAVRAGSAVNMPLHMQRLQHGCTSLGLEMPAISLLEEELESVAEGESDVVVKIIITRGSQGRGYVYEPGAEVRRIVASYTWPHYPQSYYMQGVCLKICDTRISEQPALAGIKHLNRLENVLARNEWHDNRYAEGLMLDSHERVIEGTMSNLFWVEDDRLFTPPLDRCGVHGVMRQRVMDTAKSSGIDCSEDTASIVRLEQADELFVTNSIIGIWPATLADKPVRGRVTGLLMQKLAASDGILYI